MIASQPGRHGLLFWGEEGGVCRPLRSRLISKKWNFGFFGVDVLCLTTAVYPCPMSQVSLVINYDLPNNRELYIHRIGRSGRFGRKGVAINFVRNDDIRILRDIEQYYSTQIDEMVRRLPAPGHVLFPFPLFLSLLPLQREGERESVCAMSSTIEYHTLQLAELPPCSFSAAHERPGLDIEGAL